MVDEEGIDEKDEILVKEGFFVEVDPKGVNVEFDTGFQVGPWERAGTCRLWLGLLQLSDDAGAPAFGKARTSMVNKAKF